MESPTATDYTATDSDYTATDNTATDYSDHYTATLGLHSQLQVTQLQVTQLQITALVLINARASSGSTLLLFSCIIAMSSSCHIT
jgi:hypothetical protein